MKTTLRWIVAMVAVLGLVRWSVYAENQGFAKVTSEYLRLHGHSNYVSQQRLNELGAQGWELVAVTVVCVDGGGCYEGLPQAGQVAPSPVERRVRRLSNACVPLG
jgi:hypothetical protein